MRKTFIEYRFYVPLFAPNRTVLITHRAHENYAVMKEKTIFVVVYDLRISFSFFFPLVAA